MRNGITPFSQQWIEIIAWKKRPSSNTLKPVFTHEAVLLQHARKHEIGRVGIQEGIVILECKFFVSCKNLSDYRIKCLARGNQPCIHRFSAIFNGRKRRILKKRGDIFDKR